MHYGEMKTCDIANGPGVRVSLFVSGCRNGCKNCFNPMTWAFDYGNPYTEEVEERILSSLSSDYVEGLTILGGEPFEKENQECVLGLVKKVKEKYPQKDIWIYSGFTLEELTGFVPSRASGPLANEILQTIDVLVDGRFVEEEKDISLRFRGSRNQRIIDTKQTLKQKQVVLFMK